MSENKNIDNSIEAKINDGSSTFAMVDLILGANKSCLIYCAAMLNIVDHLFNKPMNANQLAVVTETQPEMMYRFLRALASMGVLAENDQHQFSVTDLGLTLKSGIKGGVKNFALGMLGPVYIASGNLLYTIRTGKTAFDHVFGMSHFDYLKAKPELGEIFTNSMKECTDISLAPLLASGYDYSGFKHIIDIGGGIGDFLIDILEHTPTARGTVFDLGYVVEQAKREIEKNNSVKDRCDVVAGNFFDFVPPGGDCYIIKGILHDWSDEEALKILANIRQQLKNGSKLLVMEIPLPEGNEPHPYKIMDMFISTIFSGKERTKNDFMKLYAKASLKLTQISKIDACEIQIMEIEPL